MRIYDAEKRDGLAEQIERSTATQLIAPAKVVNFLKSETNTDEQTKTIQDLISGSSNRAETVEDLIGSDQPDLAMVVSVLVSVGWNLNDDVFCAAELWKARETPIHKPMNLGHNGGIIIGHIVDSRAVDKLGNTISADGDTVPSDFDIEVAGVVYKTVPERKDLIQEILTKAEKGEMFVSMECLFPDFSYAIRDKATGAFSIIERNEETAFLTKHLKIFGGTGEFNNMQLGRVIKDMVFCGQAFVECPANPESVIRRIAAGMDDIEINDVTQIEETLEGGVGDMDGDKDNGQNALNERIKALETQNTGLVEELAKNKENDFETKLSASNSKVDELTEEVAKTQKCLDESITEKAEVQKTLDEATKNLEEIKAEVAVVEKIAKGKERLAKLSKIRAIEDDAIESTLTELSEMSDENFNVVLKYAGGKAETSSEPKETDKDDKDKVADTATASLETAKTDDKDANCNVVSEDTDNDDENVALALAHTLSGKTQDTEGGE